MSFLQPWMLVALPLIAIPIIIHLVNQRRFQTVPWAAMRFLLEANKMSSGYTKLRQWLILAMRTLALAALVLFTARPLTSGIMALLGGDSNRLAIVVLDRSPSMSETLPGANGNKLQMAIQQLGDTFRTLGIERIVAIDPISEKPEEYSSVSQWIRATPQQTWSATTDIPGMLEKALLYAKNNRVGNTLVWLCSDMRDSDWRSRDGRWKAIQDGFKTLPQDVRFSVLDLSGNESNNRSVRVTSAERIDGPKGPELSLNFRIDRSSAPSENSSNDANSIPVEIAVGENRSVLNVELNGNSAEVNDHRIPLELVRDDPNASRRGWGSVRLPSDSNPADDQSYFVFEQPPTRRTVIVSDTPELVAAIELCASIAPQQSVQCEAELLNPSQLDALDWNSVALMVWHQPLPTGKTLETLEKFVSSGGQLLLVPPESPDSNTAFGIQWMGWENPPSNPKDPSDANGSTDANASIDGGNAAAAGLARIEQWQNDSQLLANTLSGAPLPLGQLGIRRVCKIAGDITPLASLRGGTPVLAKIDRTDSSITICATTPSDRDSTFAGDGIVLYVTIQRLLAIGANRVGTAKDVVAGTEHRIVNPTSTMASGPESVPSSEYAMHSGIYLADDILVAINRGLAEEDPRMVDQDALQRMFGDLSWAKINAGKPASTLVQEIWRWFVVAMLAALLIEAILCLPRIKRPIPAKTSI
ncbi:MAG: BatA domain-containing protein [Pirellula sp.]